MKKLFISFVLIAATLSSFAFSRKGGNEQWVTCGVRGGFSSTWMLNQNMLQDKGLKYQASWGGYGGIMLGFHATSAFAVNVEGLYAMYSQKTKSNIDSMAWTSMTKLTHIDIPILLHFDTETFKYFEVGAKIGLLNGASTTYSSSSFSASSSDKKPYEKTNVAAMLGWGSAFWGNGGGLLNFGLRFTYGLTDLISKDGGKGNDYYPLGDGTNAKPKAYKPTNYATVGAHLSYDFDLGWVTQSSCKRKYKFTLFSH